MSCPPVPPSPQPTQDGFLSWVRSAMGIPTSALPDDSPYVGYAYNVAIATVNQKLAQVPGPQYMLAVYNLGGDRLVNWAPDQTGSVYPTNNPEGLGYFAFLRKQFGVYTFNAGVVSAASDEGTSDSLEVVESLKTLTIGQLQNLKTFWGRTYLDFASAVGSQWGIT